MAIRHYDVTLSGATRAVTAHLPVREVVIENPTGNAVVYVGASNVASTTYGFTVAAGAKEHLGPFSGGLPLSLDSLYFRGTDTQVIHILAVTS